jgi:hypothetical protein
VDVEVMSNLTIVHLTDETTEDLSPGVTPNPGILKSADRAVAVTVSVVATAVTISVIGETTTRSSVAARHLRPVEDTKRVTGTKNAPTSDLNQGITCRHQREIHQIERSELQYVADR